MVRRRRDRLFHKEKSVTTNVSELKSAKEEYIIKQSSKLNFPDMTGHSWYQTIKPLLSINKNISIPALWVRRKLQTL